jgi:hypothetical protein
MLAQTHPTAGVVENLLRTLIDRLRRSPRAHLLRGKAAIRKTPRRPIRTASGALGLHGTRDAMEFERAVAKAEQEIERLVQSRAAEKVLEALQRMLQEQRQGDSAAVAPGLATALDDEDVAVMLDANDFAARAGISDQTVRNWEKAGKLFSVLGPMRSRGRLYPAFQLRPSVRDSPLERILEELGDLDGASKYQFFTTPVEHLAGLSPLDVLRGTVLTGDTPERARRLLSLETSERTAAVLRAAKAARSSRY